MIVQFTDDAKATVQALKFIASCCTVMPMHLVPSKSMLFIAQETNNRAALMELSITGLAGMTQHGAERTVVVESKALAAALRGVTTLKDELSFDFGEAGGVTVTVRSGDDTTTTFLPHQNSLVLDLDTSMCRGDAVVAGRIDYPTRELESLIKDAIKCSSDTTIRIEVRVDADNVEKIFVGADATDEILLMRPGSGYAMMFDRSTIQTFVKPTLANKVSLHIYQGLPLKLAYCLYVPKKKKKAAAKKGNGGGGGDDDGGDSAKTACLQIYVSPMSA